MSHKSDMLRIDRLCVTYRGGFRAVDEVSLTVGCDEVVALVGESGCGKSTTLRAVLGLLPARAAVTGHIEIDGQPLHVLDRRRRDILRQRAGYVSQDPFSVYDPLRRVRHHIVEPLRARGAPIDDAAISRRVAAAGVHRAEKRWRQYPHQWSGGMLQRADIIAATALAPPITLADEPTSALDADLADDMMRVLREQSEGLLFVTHDLELAARHADRILVMDAGCIVEEGAAAGLLALPTHARTRRLVDAVRERSDAVPGRDRPAGAIVASARSVTKHYGAETAVAAADLSVRAGEIVGIYGRSGSGKSTLLRLIGGLEEPDSGGIDRVDGAAVLPIFQDPVGSLDARWPIWRSITEPLLAADRRNRPGRRERAKLAAAALSQVGLGGIDPGTYPSALSVGQCQRVAIARVVCAKPELVVADEPTASLDVTTSSDIAKLLRELGTRGTALVIVSHDVAFLRSVADRILRMEHGRLSIDGDDDHDDLSTVDPT